MKKFLINIITAHSGVSSKRFCGLMGWITCLVICIYCTCASIQAPEITEILFICSTSLLGIDSITGIWRKNINKND